eukprot:12968327-Ditylum_brightwellii.AAC.1
MVDIFGDHYFECRGHSKLWLHNKYQDIYKAWLNRLVKLTGLAKSSAAIVCKLTGVSLRYPSICPLDIGIHFQSSLKCLDITITGNTLPTQYLSD